MNILFIIADMFRADCLGATGNPVIRTPNLDDLAADGAAFTSCFTQAAPCGPSRSCIYTSRYLCSTRSLHNETPLVDAEDNFGFALRAAGFEPELIGYNDYAVDPAILPDGDPRKRSLSNDNILPGFQCVYFHPFDSEEYFESLRRKGYPQSILSHEAIHRPNLPPEGPGEHLEATFPANYRKEDSECRYVTQKAIEYVQTRKRRRADSPGWVLSLNYLKPHPPYVCCDPFHRMVDPTSVPAPVRRLAELQPEHPYLRLAQEDRGADEKKLTSSEKHLRELRACYYGMISELDDNLGLLFEALMASDQWDSTLIVFTSDHGHCLGDHHVQGAEHFYDSAMRVPLIIRDPSPQAAATRGRQVDDLVESIDTAPTLLDYLCVSRPDRFQGRSLLARVRGDADYVPRTQIHFECDYRPMVLARRPQADPDRHLLWVVRDHEYKYIQFADEAMPPILIDLKEDPGEFENIAGTTQGAAVMARYCQELLRWRMIHEDQRMARWAQTFR